MYFCKDHIEKTHAAAGGEEEDEICVFVYFSISVFLHLCISVFLNLCISALFTRGPMLRQERRIVRPANPEQWPRVTQIKAKRFPPPWCHHHHVLRVDAIFCPPGSVTVSPENWFFVAHVVVPQISRVDISTQPALPRKIILFAQFLKSSSRPDVPGLFYAPRCTRSKKKNST